MNVRPCPSCGQTISTQAFACPKCGHQFRNPGSVNVKDPVHVIGLVICAVIILGVIVAVVMLMSGAL